MSRFLIKWVRYFSLKHLPHKDENSENGRVAKVERTLSKRSSLPVEQTFNEAFGDTANTAVVVKIGRLRIQKADGTKLLISKMKLFLEPNFNFSKTGSNSFTALQIRLGLELLHTYSLQNVLSARTRE